MTEHFMGRTSKKLVLWGQLVTACFMGITGDRAYCMRRTSNRACFIGRTTNIPCFMGLSRFCMCVNLGLTSLSTIFQSYHDGVWLRQGAQCSLL